MKLKESPPAEKAEAEETSPPTEETPEATVEKTEEERKLERWKIHTKSFVFFAQILTNSFIEPRSLVLKPQKLSMIKRKVELNDLDYQHLRQMVVVLQRKVPQLIQRWKPKRRVGLKDLVSL